MEEKHNTGIRGCDTTLVESIENCGESISSRSNSSVESYSSGGEEGESSSQSDSSTASTNSSSNTNSSSSSDKTSSSTEATAKLVVESKGESFGNSLNYGLPEVVPVLVAPAEKVEKSNGGTFTGSGDEGKTGSNTSSKLSKEEKKRIRKLRKKLAATSLATARAKAAASASTTTDGKESESAFLVDNFDDRENSKDCEKQPQQQHNRHHHRHHHPHRHPLKERKKNRNLVGYKMLGKLSCVSCVDALRECCGVANDEPTNGVKILRRKDPPVDLHTDLPTLSNGSVVQRLKLILEKLESGQLDTVPPEVLQKNIQYAIQLIQDGDPVKDRTVPCQLGPSTSPPTSASVVAVDESAALSKLAHNIRHHQQQQQPSHPHHPQPSFQQQQQQKFQQKRQSSTPTPCVASSTAFLAAATASAAAATTNLSSTSSPSYITPVAEESSAELTQQHLPQSKTLSSSDTTTTTTITETPILPRIPSPPVPVSVGETTTDLPNVTIVPQSNTVVVAVTNSNNDNDITTTTSTPTTATTTSPPTIVTPTKSERKGSIAGAAAPPNDTLTVPESRRRDESDNELSEVDEEVIPEEVRKWLASTFTKTVQPKPRLEPRPRFRSVANAIRVGLFVDRFYRQLSATTLEIPADVQQYLKEVNNWHFDIFRLHDKSSGHSLKYVAKELFSRYGIVSRFRLNLDKLESYLTAVEYGYTKLKNPYHNDIHAADVTQTLHYFIGSTGLANMFTDLEIFSLLFAALIHDFEHTGRTNNFHVNVGTELALLYNDRSVLENHHVSAAFRLLREEDKSILSNLKPEEFRDFRNLVIEMVLSTDMSTHFAQIKNVRAILNGEKVSSTTTMALMSLLLHTADISHPGKPWRMHKKFADTILEEFFLQGDEEAKLGLPFSPLCDRNNVLIPESQISFIEFIVEPSLTIMTDLIDFVQNVDDNSNSGPMLPSGGGGGGGKSSGEQQSNSDQKKSVTENNNAISNSNNNNSSNSDNKDSPAAESSSTNNNSDKNSSASSNTSTAPPPPPPSRVPPPVPSRQGKSQIKPFQNLSASSTNSGASGRRTESENCIKTAAAATSSSSSNNSSSEATGKIPLSSRTPSFPLQSGSNHNYGPVLRPWINHLVENKAKWRMISAEHAAELAAAAAAAGEDATQQGCS